MTNKEIIIQLLTEVTGWSAAEVEGIAKALHTLSPVGTIDLDLDVTDEDAQFLLAELRKQQDAIKLMLIEQGFIPLSREGSA